MVIVVFTNTDIEMVVVILISCNSIRINTLPDTLLVSSSAELSLRQIPHHNCHKSIKKLNVN